MNGSGPTLAQLLLQHPLPAELPLIYSSAEAYTGETVRRAATDLSETMVEAGVRPGQVVAGLVSEGANPLVVMYAIWMAGAVYMPCNTRLTDDEIRDMVTETPPALMVGPADRMARLEPRCAQLIEQAAMQWGRPDRVDGAGQPYDRDVALVMRTSGTTGRAKAVLLRHSGTIEGLDAILTRFRANSTTRSPKRGVMPNLIPVSLGLWSGIYNTLFAFRAGAPVVVLERFTTAALVDAIKRYDVRSTVLAPAMINMLSEDSSITDLAPLRLVRSITAPLRKEEAERFYARFGVTVLNSYGQTELGGEVVGWTAADVRDFGTSKLGAAGRPHGGIDVQVRGPDGEVLGSEQSGAIWVRSPFLMRGYANDADSFGDRLSPDGYLRTGDQGRIDGDGFLWIEGRETDMINRGGLKVIPDEVEEVLVGHPAVADACVAGIPDPRLGEVPYAWIVPSGEFEPGDLEAWCRHRLAPYKVPVGFAAVEQIPRSEIGKVLRRALVENHEEGGT